MSNGRFYYSSGEGAFDLSTRFEERINRNASRKEANGYGTEHDPRFLWNRFLIAPLIGFRDSLSTESKSTFDGLAFFVMAIQGYAGISIVNLAGQRGTLSLISRVGSARAGTRFNTRGLNDDGDVANFVEVSSPAGLSTDSVLPRD